MQDLCKKKKKRISVKLGNISLYFHSFHSFRLSCAERAVYIYITVNHLRKCFKRKVMREVFRFFTQVLMWEY